MKYNPFKLILWVLFLVFVLLNSVRLFIYGFVISFMIVIVDRAFFGTRKRSDTQFLNLFFTFTSIFALCYTFSPFIRSLEFKISHPKWQVLEVIAIEKGHTKAVTAPFNFLEKVYTPITIRYIVEDGTAHDIHEEIKHYAILGIDPIFKKEVIEKELDFIHNRSLEKLIDQKAVNLYQHPAKDKIKMFKGNDGFALRHSIGSQIALLLAYLVSFGLTLYCLINCKKLYNSLQTHQTKEQQTTFIILFILMCSYIAVAITVLHYLKF